MTAGRAQQTEVTASTEETGGGDRRYATVWGVSQEEELFEKVAEAEAADGVKLQSAALIEWIYLTTRVPYG